MAKAATGANSPKELPITPACFLTTSAAPGSLGKVFAPKVLQAILGPVEASVVQHVWYATKNENNFAIYKDEDGHNWLIQSRAEMAAFLVVSSDTLFAKFGVMARLVDYGLVQKGVLETDKNQEKSLWRINFDRLALLMMLVYQLYACTKEAEWLEFVKANPAVVGSFTYKTKTGEEALFPGIVTDNMKKRGKKAKEFKKRTPFAITKTEQNFGERLCSVWGKHSKYIRAIQPPGGVPPLG